MLTPGTSGLALVSAGAGADPAYSTLGTAGIASNAVTNALLATMTAKTVKCNTSASTAAATDCTSLPNPFSAGTSLLPSIGAYRYDSNASFITNTVGAKNVLVGTASVDGATTWLNTYIPGIDVVQYVALYSISSNGGVGATFAARSSDNSNNQNVIAEICVVVQDKVGGSQNYVWCGYDQLVINSGANNDHAIGRENSIFNNGSASAAEDPYNVNPTGSSVGGRYNCAVSGGIGANNCGAAIDIINNGAKFISGIVIGDASLNTSLNAQPDAIALPHDYSITWFNSAATKTWKIFVNASNLLFNNVGSSADVVFAGVNNFYINGSAGTTCGPTLPSASFTVVKGIVTAC